MAKVFFKDPIEYIKGKISKKDRTIFCHRTAATTSTDKNFTSIHGDRTTARSASEISSNTRFGAICTRTQARLKNATKRITDESNFRSQSTYKTLYQYIWHVCADEYDAE